MVALILEQGIKVKQRLRRNGWHALVTREKEVQTHEEEMIRLMAHKQDGEAGSRNDVYAEFVSIGEAVRASRIEKVVKKESKFVDKVQGD